MSQRIDEMNSIKKIEFLKLPLLAILFVTCIFLIPSYSYAQSVPNSPQNLVATTYTSSQISLSWDAPSNNGGQPVTGYRIDYAIDSGSFTTLITNTGNTSTTYAHNGIQAGHSYSYIVYAINSVGVGSPSNIASASANQGSVPNPPQNLVASVTSSNKITLSWSSPTSTGMSPVTGYRIDYSIDSSNFISLVSSTGTTSTTYTHNGVQAGHTYRYIVYAINSAGTSSPSNIASALMTQGNVPNPPQNLDAVSSSTTQIDLSWGSPSNISGTGVTGYRIDYSIDSGNFVPLVSNTGTVSTTYSHTGVQAGHTYRYIVYAINSAGTSSPSNIASTSLNQSTVPNPPQNLVASVTSSNQITLSWNSSPDILGTGLTGYRIDYSIDSGNFVPLVSNTGSTSTTYTLTGVQPGHTYRYIVYAINSAGTSSPSNLASTSLNQQSTVPNPPQNLVASVTSSQITLSWNSDILGTGLTGYRIDYSIDSGNFVTLVSNTGSTSTTYTLTGAQPGHTYRFIVYAINSAGTSNPSNQAYATTANPTPTISILSGTIPVVNTPSTLGYSISGGQVYSASINNDTNTLNFRLQGNLPGVLYLQLPRTLIDAKQPDGSDKTFYVIVDNRNAVFTETRTGSYRALTISFPAGANDVSIIGTSVVGGVSVMGGTVPEFPIALIALVVGLAPAIFISRRFVKF